MPVNPHSNPDFTEETRRPRRSSQLLPATRLVNGRAGILEEQPDSRIRVPSHHITANDFSLKCFTCSLHLGSWLLPVFQLSTTIQQILLAAGQKSTSSAEERELTDMYPKLLLITVSPPFTGHSHSRCLQLLTIF